MKEMSPAALALIDELLKTLDQEIDLLDLRCVQLAALSRASIERDDETMESLLRDIETTQQRQDSTDRELNSIRRMLADLLALPRAEMRLAMLVEVLDGPQRTAVAGRRQAIVTLMEQLKRQHMDTALVVAESARINRMLLESLCPQSRQVTTYGVRGERSWRPESPLVDVES
ncbi:MAG: hypothetical protein ISS78_06950 [Phycisphaerae bacterium]|nr:hypothetical protein [Phycisphaerae bacterium]